MTEDWEAYFRGLGDERRRVVREREEQAQEPPETPEIVSAPRDLTAAEIAALPGRGTPAQVVKRLAGHGWEVRVRVSAVRMPAVRYLTKTDDHEIGDIRKPAEEVAYTVVGAVKRGSNGQIGLAMLATWSDKNGFLVAETYDPLDGREIRVGYMKGREPNQIEAEEGIPAPLGLKEWLADFAPTAAERKRIQQSTIQQAKEEVWDGSH